MKKRFNVGDLFLVFMLGAALNTAACEPQQREPNPPRPEYDASVPGSCALACAHLRELRCSLGDPTPKGASCETVCDNVRVNNAGVGFPAACLAQVATCELADRCK